MNKRTRIFLSFLVLLSFFSPRACGERRGCEGSFEKLGLPNLTKIAVALNPEGRAMTLVVDDQGRYFEALDPAEQFNGKRLPLPGILKFMGQNPEGSGRIVGLTTSALPTKNGSLFLGASIDEFGSLYFIEANGEVSRYKAETFPGAKQVSLSGNRLYICTDTEINVKTLGSPETLTLQTSVWRPIQNIYILDAAMDERIVAYSDGTIEWRAGAHLPPKDLPYLQGIHSVIAKRLDEHLVLMALYGSPENRSLAVLHTRNSYWEKIPSSDYYDSLPTQIASAQTFLTHPLNIGSLDHYYLKQEPGNTLSRTPLLTDSGEILFLTSSGFASPSWGFHSTPKDRIKRRQLRLETPLE